MYTVLGFLFLYLSFICLITAFFMIVSETDDQE